MGPNCLYVAIIGISFGASNMYSQVYQYGAVEIGEGFRVLKLQIE